MIIEELTTEKQLLSLKKDDKLIVQWRYHPVSGDDFTEITMNKIWGLNSLNEVIVKKEGNLYFSIDNFIAGVSSAKQVFKVIDEADAI